MDIEQSELKKFVSYDPETGVFVRTAAVDWRNKRRVGLPCSSLNRAIGYETVSVKGRNHYAHRLAWIYMNGAIPEGFRIDHINQNRSDNRIANLRLASHSENLRNCKVRRDNTSGTKGVSFDATRGKWAVHVGRRFIGRFQEKGEAVAARAKAAAAAFGAFASE